MCVLLSFISLRRPQQQYRDLRRRVARPFSRIKIILHPRAGQKKTLPNSASYVCYQSCRSKKAAILTTFIHLPGDSADGRPSPGRTGLCLGTALVRLNDKSLKQSDSIGRRRRRGRRGEGEEEEMVSIRQPQSEGGERNGSVSHELNDSSRNSQ